ncbi:hypothetical protein KCU95_g5864, partial [Aureobasidium melanogenum]
MDRRRVCDACSVRRVKCDGQAPCAACLKSSIDCTRLRQRVKSGPKGVRKKTLERLKKVRRQNAEIPNPVSTNTPEDRRGEASHDGSEVTPITTNHSPYTIEGHFSPELNMDFVNLADDNQQPPLEVPQPSSWPFRISPVLLEPYLNIYYFKLFPVWPIVDKDILAARLQSTEPDAGAYMLASSVCAATMVQLQLSVFGPCSDVLDPNAMLTEIEDLRRTYDYRESPSIEFLATSFFMHVAYTNLGRLTTSTLLLREAVTLAYILDLHRPSHYDEVTPAERQSHLRMFWILFITERAHATQHDIPCVMTVDPDMPELDTLSQHAVLSPLTMLCRMFRSFCEGSSSSLTGDTLTSFNNELLRIPTMTEDHNELQKADLSVTQQWLRLMFWKLAINKVVMKANPTDDIRSVFFPISLAKDLLSDISTMSIDTLEAHGPGMELKLFEVTNSVADIITLNPAQSQHASFQLGPQDILVHLANIIGRFRGGNKTLLPLLQSRLSSIGLGSAIFPRITEVTYDSPDTNREKGSIESNEAIMTDPSLCDGQPSGVYSFEAVYDVSATEWWKA